MMKRYYLFGIMMMLLCMAALCACSIPADADIAVPTEQQTPTAVPTQTLVATPTPEPIPTTTPEQSVRGVIEVCESDTLARDIIPQLCTVFGLSEDAVKDALASGVQSDLISTDLIYFRRMEGIIPPGQYTIYEQDMLIEHVNKWIYMAGQRYQSLYDGCAERNGLQPEQQLALASVIEWECLANEYREEVATVFLNRLEDGGKLQSCVTAEYALSYQRPYLTSDDVGIASDYNTYYVKGLPVGPICVVDDACLKAAISKKQDSDIYFFFYDYALDEMFFFSDYAEFKEACGPSRQRFEDAFDIGFYDKVNKQVLYGNGPAE